jgi:hypothetical protein
VLPPLAAIAVPCRPDTPTTATLVGRAGPGRGTLLLTGARAPRSLDDVGSRLAQTGAVHVWNSFLFEPLVAFLGVGVLALLLRWAFGRGGSLIARPPTPGSPDEYGLLVPVAAPRTDIDGELLVRKLEDHGLRATLAHTKEGPRLLVFAGDEGQARAILDVY